jgi:hypothetical protein
MVRIAYWLSQALVHSRRPVRPSEVNPRLEQAALSTSRDIAGLIAWARREEWRGALARFFEHHSAQARGCR